jgi:RTX calcium-binding nonapeptide repeat (4 copies)
MGLAARLALAAACLCALLGLAGSASAATYCIEPAGSCDAAHTVGSVPEALAHGDFRGLKVARKITLGGPPVLRPGTCLNLFAGTALDDRIVGSGFGDAETGGLGDDDVDGLGGDDCLLGDPGDDVLRGGPGSDDVRGMPGDDETVGGTGDDSVTGGSGDDTLSGGRGADRLSGGSGDDSYSAGAGNDTIDSRDGVAETIGCGSGRDSVRADRRDHVVRCERVKRR